MLGYIAKVKVNMELLMAANGHQHQLSIRLKVANKNVWWVKIVCLVDTNTKVIKVKKTGDKHSAAKLLLVVP